jgi:alpha-maltose-1-phosphate synthase
MKVAIFTNEFPPNIYGGAGIHVDFLTRELKKLTEIEVHCFGDQQHKEDGLCVTGHGAAQHFKAADPRYHKILDTIDRNVSFTAGVSAPPDIVHCHTWYSHWAGVMSSVLHGAPLVLTTHSLEPHRPWKVEQLGNGYHLSTMIERFAYQNAHGIIAVSQEMRKDVIETYQVDPAKVRVIHNGIDLDFYSPQTDNSILADYGIDSTRPYILFVGRITRQKGITQLVKAIPFMDESVQIVLCAGAPDTPEIQKEMEKLVAQVQAKRSGVIWIDKMLDHKILRTLYSHARAFVCPSLYEPFGIINLEAMACATPVIGSAVGGIPEIIVDGETGFLVPFEAESKINFEPEDPVAFQKLLAEKVNTLVRDPALAQKMGEASRLRAEKHFSWTAIAAETLRFYNTISEQFKNNR